MKRKIVITFDILFILLFVFSTSRLVSKFDYKEGNIISVDTKEVQIAENSFMVKNIHKIKWKDNNVISYIDIDKYQHYFNPSNKSNIFLRRDFLEGD